MPPSTATNVRICEAYQKLEGVRDRQPVAGTLGSDDPAQPGGEWGQVEIRVPRDVRNGVTSAHIELIKHDPVAIPHRRHQPDQLARRGLVCRKFGELRAEVTVQADEPEFGMGEHSMHRVGGGA